MPYNPQKHHRRSIRLKGYDYSQEGAYFITICCHNRQGIFGEIKNGKMHLNKYGKIAETEWRKTAVIRNNVELDEFIIMPNHVHGIIKITDVVGAYCNTPQQIRNTTRQIRNTPQQIHNTTQQTGFRSPSQTIGSIIRGFKSTTTKQINQIRHTPGLPVWQRNYYEHIIRNKQALHRIRYYIINNPKKLKATKK